MTVGNQHFFIGDQKQITGIGGFDCPICRQKVRRAFRFEETCIADDLKTKIKTKIDQYLEAGLDKTS